MTTYALRQNEAVPLLLTAALALAQTTGLPKSDGVQAYIFELRDCPLANAFAPEINRIVAKFKHEKVTFAMVYLDSDGDANEAKKHAKDYGLQCPVLLDPKQTFAQKAGITHSPEAAVFNGAKLLYRGRINNLYATPAKRRTKPTSSDLSDAITAVLKNREVKVPRTEAIGCLLPRPQHPTPAP